jgi:glycolate oxidase iron-sulfur subunit
MLLLRGCVQPAIAPQIQQATRAVFASLGIELIVAPEARCCGAVRQHLGDPAGALVDARRNIDAWWPHIEAGIEAIVVDASGCGIAVADYGHLLRDDASYSAKAKRVSALYRDPVQVMGASAVELKSAIDSVESARIAFHPPCTLQHGLKLPRAVESLLGQLGYELLPLVGAPMCCGSAGTYSMMQPEIATELRARRLEVLLEGHPEIILSANVGCITHLAAASPVPVQHWLEFIAARLVPTSKEMR